MVLCSRVYVCFTVFFRWPVCCSMFCKCPVCCTVFNSCPVCCTVFFRWPICCTMYNSCPFSCSMLCKCPVCCTVFCKFLVCFTVFKSCPVLCPVRFLSVTFKICLPFYYTTVSVFLNFIIMSSDNRTVRKGKPKIYNIMPIRTFSLLIYRRRLK